MFKYLLIELAVNTLKDFLTKPDAKKFRKVRVKLSNFLKSEKTQNTIAEVFMRYNDFIDSLGEEGEEKE